MVSTARATTVESRDGQLRVATVEHLLAALAGLGIYEGLTILVQGPELPLLDGGAAAWCRAVAGLGLPGPRAGAPGSEVRGGYARSGPRLRVGREATLEVGLSRFDFTPGEQLDLSVCIDLGDARGPLEARWRGEPGDFVERIAPARTFTLGRDIEDLVRQGLARHVDPTSVVVLAPEGVHCAGRPFVADEPARHKLLDLMGDLYLHGGPPVGRLHAVRPGHAANLAAIRRALDESIVLPF